MLTENEIRPDDLMAEQARLFAEDISYLMRHREAFMTVSCPACDSHNFTFAFEKTQMPFVSCNDCQTLYANPRPRPEHMDDFYKNSKNYQYWSEHIFPASEKARREKIFIPRVEMVLGICDRFDIPTNTILEVGAGFGIFCEEIQETKRFTKVVAIEPTPYLANNCRKRNLTVIEKPIEHIAREEIVAENEKINVITNFEVIEHLFSPKEFIGKCFELLEPGGIFIVTCPNSKGFDIVTLGKQSTAVDVEHVNLFNPDSLSRLLESYGFEVIDRQTPGRLDAELVRKQVLTGEFDISHQPFLKQILIDEWAEKGTSFQNFLSVNNLSSNLLIVGRKP